MLQQQAYQSLSQILIQRRTHPFIADSADTPSKTGSIQLGNTTDGLSCSIEEELLAKHLLAVG